MIEDRNEALARQQPLHEWTRRVIEDRIEQGRYRVGEPLPSAAALASELSVSLITVRRALRELRFTGAIRATPGVGTFVNDRQRFIHHLNHARDPLYGLREDAERVGKEVGIRMLSVELQNPTDPEFGLFGVFAGEHYCIKKIILIDGYPVTIDKTYVARSIPQDLLEDFTKDFIYDVLKRRKFDVPASKVYIDADPASEEAAHLLGISAGFPMLRRFYAPEIAGVDLSIYGIALSPFDRIGIMISR